MYTVAGLAAYIIAIGLLYATRHRLGVLGSTSAFTAVTLLYLEFGFDPPLPWSIVLMFGGTAVISVLLYATSSDELQRGMWRPIHAVMVEPRLRPVLIVVLVAIPAAVAAYAWSAALPNRAPPPLVRSVHPAPPGSITVRPPAGATPVTVDLINGANPLRALEKSDPPGFARSVERGKTVYYQNCFYCHGDRLLADGHLAAAMTPPPAKFDDQVLPMFQETFFFWRIAKGGPGLPGEGTPWDSTMPAWEKFIGADDMWSVILFLYEQQGLPPRASEGGH